MHLARFDGVEIGPDAVRLRGRFLHARITLTKGGVFRVLAYSRAEDEPKRSWVIDDDVRLPLRAREEDGVVVIEGDGAMALRVSPDPFSFRWDGGVHLRDLHVRRTKMHIDVRHMHAIATTHDDPLQEVVDGIPFGAGLTATLADPPGGRWYATGERTGFLDKRGRIWTNWNTDQSRHVPTADPLYQSHPFAMGLRDGRAFGLYLDESWRTVFDLAASEPDRSVLHTDGPTFDLYLIPGPTPKEVLERFTALVGRASMPPLWALGFHQCRWGYPNEAAVRAIVEEYERREIPLDAMWLDIDHMDGYRVFTFAKDRFPDPAGFVRDLDQKGIRTVVILDPGVKKEDGYDAYESGLLVDAFVKDRREELLVGEVWPKPAVWPDFVREDVRAWWTERCGFYLDKGVAGLWCDMNEPSSFNFPDRTLPPASRHGKYLHAEVHNVYGAMMAKATHDALRRHRPDARPFVLTRAGFTGIQKHAFVWTGDNASWWEHLEQSLPMCENLGLSGVPFVGADIGGFAEDATGELLARWTWAGIVYPFMRNHAGKGTRRQEPWSFGEPFTSAVREAIRFRRRLLPYLYRLAREACETGVPPLRPLVLEHPDDGDTHGIHDEALLGRDLLAAPILRPGHTKRLVYLPEGAWVDFWTGEALPGKSWITVEAAIDRMPLFQRAGSAIPLADGAAGPLRDARWPELVWRVALAEAIAGSVYEDDGDGPANGTTSELSGTFDGRTLDVSFRDAAGGRKSVWVEVAGHAQPSTSSAATRATIAGFAVDVGGGGARVSWP